MDIKKAFEINRETQNNKVAVHAKSDFYNLEEFKNGKSSLNNQEMLRISRYFTYNAILVKIL